MGFVNTEQTTAIIESVAKVVEASNPVVPVTPQQSYWWWLSLGIIPVLLGWWLNKRKKKP